MEKQKKHELLKLQAAEMLNSLGFSNAEIKFEYKVGNFRADVVGIKTNYRVAIECGRTPMLRYNALKKEFDKVQILRYRSYVPLEERRVLPVYGFVIAGIDSNDMKLIREITEKSGTTISEFMRTAITKYLEHVHKYGVPDHLDVVKRLRELENKCNELESRFEVHVNGVPETE